MSTETTLATVSSLLRGIGSVASVEGVEGAAIGTLLTFGADLIDKGEAGADSLSALNDQVTAMVAANRGPTDDELSELKARSDAAHDTIQKS